MDPSVEQLSLFGHVQSVYADNADRPLANDELYEAVAERMGTPERLTETEPVGQAGQRINVFKRAVRWAQQSLRLDGVLTRIPEERGVWALTHEGRRRLTAPAGGASLLAYATDLGIAIWGDVRGTALKGIGQTIALCITSPPYPLQTPRAYGGPNDEQEYVDFVCRVLEPVVAGLVDGGSIALNISNDIFKEGSPARSLYRQRLTLALHDRLGLEFMDEIPWVSNKIPGPTRWASHPYRYHLRYTWEPVLWFTNNPHAVRADNRRVLQPHTEKMKRLMERGGEQERRTSGDGAQKIRPGSYGRQTEGKIPTNVLNIGTTCQSQREAKRIAADNGLPPHGAPFPLSLPRFLIEWLTEKGDLVVDPMGGSGTTPVAAETLGRSWISVDRYGEYVATGGLRHTAQANPNTWINPDLLNAVGVSPDAATAYAGGVR